MHIVQIPILASTVKSLDLLGAQVLPSSSHQSRLPLKAMTHLPFPYRPHLHGHAKGPPVADSRAHSQLHWRCTHAQSGPSAGPSLSSWPWSPPLSAHPRARKSPIPHLSQRRRPSERPECRKWPS